MSIQPSIENQLSPIESHYTNAGDLILCYEDAVSNDKTAIKPLTEWALDEIYHYFESTKLRDNNFNNTIDLLNQFSIVSNDYGTDSQWLAGKVIAVNHHTNEKLLYRPS